MRSVLWTSVGIVAALLAQSALSHVLPQQARVFDPFLLVLVYCGLSAGETHGMLAGAAAGWVQDVHFGGPIMGLSGLTKVLVGFGVGLAGTRFLLTGTVSRILVLVAATVVNVALFQSLASVFEIQIYTAHAQTVALQAGLNALVGAVLFEFVDRRVRESRI
jgi:rod shape-determining protein MreD